MAKYLLVNLIKDQSVRNAVSKALQDDGRLSFNDVRAILRSALDGDGVTPQEFSDLKAILANAKTLDTSSRQLIDGFLRKYYRPMIHQKPVPTGQLTTNFNVSEFTCKDGTAVPPDLLGNVKTLATNLQALRDALGKPVKISSAHRTIAHNKAVGGASNSQHLYAKAADIVVSGMTPHEVKKQIESLIKTGKMAEGGIGLYNSFVYYDVRGSKARW